MELLNLFKKNRDTDETSSNVEREQIKENPTIAEEQGTVCFGEEQVEAIIKRVEEKTAKSSYRLKVNMERKPDLWETKFGGVPYWTSGQEYPCDSEGKPLVLLAQLNMKDFAGNAISR